jgi:hypothetical protein
MSITDSLNTQFNMNKLITTNSIALSQHVVQATTATKVPNNPQNKP